MTFSVNEYFQDVAVVKPGTKVKAPVETRDQPGATYAVYTHKGPYEEIQQAYANLVGRIESGPIDGPTADRERERHHARRPDADDRSHRLDSGTGSWVNRARL